MNERCAYCEKPGELFPIRRMPGQYHLRCIEDAKKALEAGRKSLFSKVLDRALR